ncbi:isoamylase early set domain-containing protein [Dyadobacter frigoris]|uniref:Glycoside hydrolase n=1 Tax=Dyadobacter frigoris TaxID=2576211 RepID=A0A4U6D906_9BACT|nr:isoamylase early set domain-containing protein [Dyadobacter frigoris]TKT93246.1 glycoside hydrolase [Dyadobacter frigoris]GLU54876.1 1,4-alpha-glucan-branching protein [Dyadobacter frigoris]
MAITKQYLKSKPVVKVTFTLPAEAVEKSETVTLVGEFNGWNPEEAVALKKQKDGSFKASLDLVPGKEYQFRYLLDNEIWANDWEADKYVSAGINAEENSVVVL